METSDIDSPSSPSGRPGSALDLFCADPLLRSPLAGQLTSDGHIVRVHDAPLADPFELPAGSPVVVVHPSSMLDVVQDRWLPFTRVLLDRSPMVLVARSAALPRAVLARRSADHGLILLDRDHLPVDWMRAVSTGVGRLATGVSDIDVTFQRPANQVTGLGALTRNERVILDLLAAGLSNSAIAECQFVGERTVESHIRRIFAKLELPSTPAVNRRVLAARLALSLGRDDAMAVAD